MIWKRRNPPDRNRRALRNRGSAARFLANYVAEYSGSAPELQDLELAGARAAKVVAWLTIATLHDLAYDAVA